ncbi:DUF484 family protein [Marinomonas pollencensis]|uniref:DUF484 family protein n=1 Tax=Marinomonas pollencensis TaxID=491954 RepID=A0A3E0DNG1_9GAMM|nr:DUF484 family protein [Marinomonas pollencensis]REG83027.1 hypothetical protein DFP81_107207 [Marinomonas pollencensis]
MNEAEVIQYLSNKPDFFVKNPELLESLTLPHPVHGGVISLLEYQVSLLRKSTAEYRREFDRLIEVARENEAIMQKTRRFILAGLDCTSLDDFAVVVDDMVRDDFSASCHAFVLFGEGYDTAIRCCSDGDVAANLSSITKMKQSACGALAKKELVYLFQEDASKIKSHAVMPIISLRKGKKQVAGVLVLGAASKETFAKKKETLFLEHIAELLNVLIQRLSS